MAFLNFFFWLKETELLHKKSHYGPIFFLLDYYFSVLEETKSPLNGFLSTQIKNSGWTPFHVKTELLFASERARFADSGSIFGFKIEER